MTVHLLHRRHHRTSEAPVKRLSVAGAARTAAAAWLYVNVVANVRQIGYLRAVCWEHGDLCPDPTRGQSWWNPVRSLRQQSDRLVEDLRQCGGGRHDHGPGR